MSETQNHVTRKHRNELKYTTNRGNATIFNGNKLKTNRHL